MSTPKTATPGTLSGALLRAQQTLGAVGKDASNDFQGYDYVSAEKMITESRAVLHRAGLVFFVSGVELDGEGIRVAYTLQHPSSGEGLEIVRVFPVVPGKGRPADKAHAGALTACLSYTLRDLLLIPRVDPSIEMDHSSRVDEPAEEPREEPADLIASLRAAMGEAMEAGRWDVEDALLLIENETGQTSADDLTDEQARGLLHTITTTTGPTWAATQGAHT